ncbi:putative reverse transcriptase domain-containing protein [Tanacetum coccineum]|uniref:Reverse transcriptase domain-containing protein n=1 Tax=Tanacetum coccineum TaxID=301880 RepID=A0ABQ5H7H2_9ASTR
MLSSLEKPFAVGVADSSRDAEHFDKSSTKLLSSEPLSLFPRIDLMSVPNNTCIRGHGIFRDNSSSIQSYHAVAVTADDDIPKTAFRKSTVILSARSCISSLDECSSRCFMDITRIRKANVVETDAIEAGKYSGSSEQTASKRRTSTLPSNMVRGLDKQFGRKKDGRLYFVERIWVPAYGILRTLVMTEAHATKYSIHPEADKMYYDLRDLYWWPRMKKHIAMYVSKCFTCSKVKRQHQENLGITSNSQRGFLSGNRRISINWKITVVILVRDRCPHGKGEMQKSDKKQGKKDAKTMVGVDVDTLTMEQYLALSRENQAPGMVDRLALGTINTWDLLKKAFIQRYCPPTMTAKQLEDIHNFKKKGDESLYQAWERLDAKFMKDLTSKRIDPLTSKLNKLKRSDMENLDEQHLLMGTIEESFHQEESARRSTKMEVWIKKLQENAEISTRNQNASLKNLETQIEQLTEELRSRKENFEQAKVVIIEHEGPSSPKNLKNLHRISFLSNSQEENIIGNINFYAMADLGASVNVLPRNIFEYLELINLSETEMLVEMADMRKKGTTWDRRPFLAIVHAQISVFEKEISVGIGDERVKLKKGHLDISKSVKKDLFRLWVVDQFTEALDPDKDHLERCLDEYNWVFHKEIKQLADEYEIKIGEKGQVLEEIWTKCKRAQFKNKDWWYDYWYEDEEKTKLGDENYNPPMVHTETFEVTKYKFDNGCNFICVNGENNETLSLGRKNGSRFRKMIMEEIEEVLRNDGEDSDGET